MTTDLETALLRAFVTSVKAGSISRAATALGHSQPALSQQLRRLERVVGQPLLHRAATGVSLTTTGEALMPYAERILALSSQALQVSRSTLDGHCGVGLLEDLATPVLTSALAEFTHFHPDITLELVSLPGPAMREAFVSGRVDLALCDPAYLPEPSRWTARMPLVWAQGPGIDIAADPLPLVLFSQPCRWRDPVLQTLERSGRRWRVVFESTSLAGVQAAVRAGLGVSALLPPNLEPGTVAPSLPELPEVEFGLVRSSATEGDRLVDAVETLLRRLV
ncbi:LysR substrate-binding domain-containing protein [Streptomyces tropicalis]|uniref:LysR substrate-binding domain-containing protein n=1 Tax=Streptomyces tropicalis TaxID=3034234 RepID=A0ABT6A465_9ACTN|nr:LysR substrate-binding domain-containing protein [Streptomyces tropicalis]MDF3299445.1 LysR substrate-binding domain-containing protein [Streptomyces tropicalis]